MEGKGERGRAREEWVRTLTIYHLPERCEVVLTGIIILIQKRYMKHTVVLYLFFANFHLYMVWHTSLVNNLPMNCSWAWYNQNFINYICIYVAFLKLRIDETVLNNMFFFNCKSSLPHKNMQRYKTWTGSSHLYIVKTINIHCCLVSGSLR